MVARDLVFCSGQLPKDPFTNKIVEGGVEECTVSLTLALPQRQETDLWQSQAFVRIANT